MARLVMYVALLLSALAAPAGAMEPEQREAIVISARVWEGREYRETFIPSTAGEFSLFAGNDSAISFARTLEYYWAAVAPGLCRLPAPARPRRGRTRDPA